VDVTCGDGALGRAAAAPYDRIIVAAEAHGISPPPGGSFFALHPFDEAIGLVDALPDRLAGYRVERSSWYSIV
jgi:Protein-L-isoaspartate(D-aspartate) O-methyltransferase (PCMT)